MGAGRAGAGEDRGREIGRGKGRRNRYLDENTLKGGREPAEDAANGPLY